MCAKCGVLVLEWKEAAAAMKKNKKTDAFTSFITDVDRVGWNEKSQQTERNRLAGGVLGVSGVVGCIVTSTKNGSGSCEEWQFSV